MQILQNNFISNNKYIVRFARDEADLMAAQRLRYEVFNIELGEGLASSVEERLDTDEYDKQCHHLLVISKAKDRVIGTYRVQTHDIAREKNGFYTAAEYDLSTIPQHILDASIEVGRACIDASHRNGRVLFLLWRGLAKYLIHFDKHYLFGCCSLTSQSPGEAWTVMKYLSKHNFLHDSIMVSTTKKYSCEKTEADPEMLKGVTLPQLFRLYLDLGAKVCSPPALDHAFKTIDYLVLLDIENLDEQSRMLFFN